MRKVKIVVSFSATFGSFTAGEVVELSEANANEMIQCGYCAAMSEMEGEANAVRDKDPAGSGTNKPNRRKATPKG